MTGAVKEYTYDENGNRLTFKLTINGVEQMTATYTYDKLNQLTGVTIGGDTTTYGYDDNGNILNKTTGELVTEYTYNNGNMLTAMETTQGNNSLYTYSSNYYLDGNKKTANDGGTVSQYQYNGLGQLLAETQGTEVFGYTYDAYGNRVGKTAQEETTAYTYNAGNQLLTEAITHGTEWKAITQYGYDANGNQISKLTQTLGNAGGEETVQMGTPGEDEPAAPGIAFYMYNGFGELTGLQENGTTAAYTYNADGLRVSKTVNGETTTHILDGANVVADIQGTSISKYNRGRELISMEQNGQKGYYVFNGHGDVVQMRSTSGEQVYGKRYDAFGVEMTSGTSTSQFANPFGYAGEYTDVESGNIYLRARYYNPNTGRFMSEDPAKDGTNWYVYAENNPVMYIDFWGLAITQADRNAYNSGKMTQFNWNLLAEADALWNEAHNQDYTKKAIARQMAVAARRSYDPNYVDDFDYTFGLGVSALDDGGAGYFIQTMEGKTSDGTAGALVSMTYERTFVNGRPYLRIVNVAGHSYSSSEDFKPHKVQTETGQMGIYGFSQEMYVGSDKSHIFYETGFYATEDDGGAGFNYGTTMTFTFNEGQKDLVVHLEVYWSYYFDELDNYHEDVDINYQSMTQGRGGAIGGR